MPNTAGSISIQPNTANDDDETKACHAGATLSMSEDDECTPAGAAVAKRKSFTKLIPRGTLLLQEKPFVYALNGACREQRCDFCFVESPKLLKCGNCRYIYYCNRHCQSQDWKAHRIECRGFQKVAPRIVPDCALLLARLIIKLNHGGDSVKSYYEVRKSRRWRDLMSHYDDLKGDSKRMEHVAALSGVLSDFLGNEVLPNDVELVRLYGRVVVNSFNILDTDQNTIGTGIYLGVSVTDHNCRPNAVVTFDGLELHMRSVVPMRRVDFTKIFITYVDLTDTAEQRQKALQQSYFFRCDCKRCLDPVEDMEMHAAACPNRECREPLDLRPSVRAPVEQCAKCRTPITAEHVQKYCNVMEMTKQSIENMQQVAYHDLCAVILEKHTGVLHPLNVFHVKVLDLAFEAAIQVQKWHDARRYAVQLLPGLRKYNGPYSPLVSLLHMKLGKLLLLIDELDQALIQLKKAKELMLYTHGGVNMSKTPLPSLLLEAEIAVNQMHG